MTGKPPCLEFFDDIAKGTFYNLFENKSEFMYHMMIHERKRAKEKVVSYLNSSGKLTRDSLRVYLKWLTAENPNVRHNVPYTCNDKCYLHTISPSSLSHYLYVL